MPPIPCAVSARTKLSPYISVHDDVDFSLRITVCDM